MPVSYPKIVLVAVVSIVLAGAAAARIQPSRPNFLVIVADDMGYSDLGAFGGEIATPNLDRLAKSGMRLTDFHAAPACSPTRAMLLTGADSHEVGMGAFYEVPKEQKASGEGYEGYLTHRAATIAERLKASGYDTMMVGKWHLGLEEEQSPAAQGFSQSFALLQGVANHYGVDQSGPLKTAGGYSGYRENGKPTTYPQGRYSSDYFTDRLIEYVDRVRGGGKPFFAYLAYTAPHSPLQAPAEDVARYKGKYDVGYEVIRQRRLARMKQLGIVPTTATPHAFEGVKPWADMSPEERAGSARRMEIYAAMVDRMDRNVGRLLDHLEKTGQLRNTVVVFLSDNGADGHPIPTGRGGPRAGRGGAMADPGAPDGYDNSLANLGTATSYAKYGAEWAEATSTPYRLFKGYASEGGIRTTAFISGPGVPRGRTSDAFLHVMDIAPTLLSLAGVAPEGRIEGRDVIPMRGLSWGPIFARPSAEIRTSDDPVGWELSGQKALRKGDWKITYVRPGEHSKWALYDLSSDPGEVTDLGGRYPDRLRAMVGDWLEYARSAGVKPMPGDVWPTPEEAVAAPRP